MMVPNAVVLRPRAQPPTAAAGAQARRPTGALGALRDRGSAAHREWRQCAWKLLDHHRIDWTMPTFWTYVLGLVLRAEPNAFLDVDSKSRGGQP